MEKIELKSNTEWKRWGAADPLWGVSSWPEKQKDGSSPWTDEAFYALGESDFRDYLAHWRQYGVTGESCLEIGCGAGRITRQLESAFERVHAVDVSPGMIEYAKRAVSAKVQFALIDGLSLPYAGHSVKAIFSAFVLQHLDSVDLGLLYFREFARVLDHGGTLMIQLPLYRFPYESGAIKTMAQAMHGCARRLGDLRAGMKRRFGTKMMRVTSYPVEQLYDSLAATGFRDIEFRTFPIRSNGSLFSCVLATRE